MFSNDISCKYYFGIRLIKTQHLIFFSVFAKKAWVKFVLHSIVKKWLQRKKDFFVIFLRIYTFCECSSNVTTWRLEIAILRFVLLTELASYKNKVKSTRVKDKKKPMGLLGNYVLFIVNYSMLLIKLVNIFCLE